MKTIYVIPAPGLRVPDPKTGQALPDGGTHVQRSIYWIRRIRDGSVSVQPEPPASGPAAEKSEKKQKRNTP